MRARMAHDARSAQYLVFKAYLSNFQAIEVLRLTARPSDCSASARLRRPAIAAARGAAHVALPYAHFDICLAAYNSQFVTDARFPTAAAPHVVCPVVQMVVPRRACDQQHHQYMRLLMSYCFYVSIVCARA